MSEFQLRSDSGPWPRFGDYAVVPQKRHGAPTDMYYHKVVGTLVSNSWVDVPVQSPPTETRHETSERIAIVICCGVDEGKTYRVRVSDMHKVVVAGSRDWIKCSDELPPIDTPVWLRMADNIMIVGERGSSTDGWMWAACYGIYFNAIGEWDANESDASDEHEPTHWQALPLPPSE